MLLIAWYTDNCVEVQGSGKSKRAPVVSKTIEKGELQWRNLDLYTWRDVY